MDKQRFAQQMQSIGTYLTVLQLSGNYNERQRIGLTNQQLPAYVATARKDVLSAVARGLLADEFLRQHEAEWPTHGKSLPDRFNAFVEAALGEAGIG